MSASQLETIARLSGGPVVVVGSLPPHGRDIDLLVPNHETRAELRRRLIAEGWVGLGDKCARLDVESTEVLELLTPADLGLGDEQAASLFERSVPLGASSLVRTPAPHHSLLIFAGRGVRSGRRISEKRRRRIAAILAEDHLAFERAEQEAGRWGLVAALAALRSAYELGTPISRGRRARAIAEERSARGEPRVVAGAKAWRAVMPRGPRRRTFIVALSGLDGAGKSTQAEALRDALHRLGYGAEVRWSSLIAYPGFLTEFRKFVNRILAALERPSTAGALRRRVRAEDRVAPRANPGNAGLRRGRSPDAAKRLRLRSPVVAFLWTSMVALRNGIEHRRVTRPNLRRGRVVICDRYLLDSKVALRYDYGEDKRFGFQSALIRLVSPRADRAFLLAVSPQTASRRKADYELEQNLLRARLYDEEAARLDVRRIEGERPRNDVLAEIAGEVWLALSARRGRARRLLRRAAAFRGAGFARADPGQRIRGREA